jgi:NAD+ diphosphatase
MPQAIAWHLKHYSSSLAWREIKVEINFCRRCGSALTAVETSVFVCANKHHTFAKATPASGLFLVNSKNEILFAVRGREPNKGMLDTPGGFCLPYESFSEAVRREVEEELGLKPESYGELQYINEAIDTYTYENETFPVTSLIFWARTVNDNFEITASDDVGGFEWIAAGAIDFDRIPKDSPSVWNAARLLQQLLLI